ncbi:proteasome assembly chaperone 4 family protein ASCRUDRAFT_7641 [Ascoidea rubescens DSM 1968]|uniref:Uncharacterized protein n=1 Tax=Ascoidea rubescens DSM 1968 TaxID=1344418 RepID=A0A1D2VIC4_9ASCO|nr:hypothetical protein ASCRUDRAFT_7641 [Ascoidea rubescens DSM 1968]ODV61406.1 hypothetical protein ASCRUDRAFT_7641 [Ascoidea rubescens DSM 1968]
MAESFSKTYSEELAAPFSDPIHICLTIPSKRPTLSEKNKIPIIVFLSKTGGNSDFGCYIYSIPNFLLNRSNDKQNEIVSTILNDSEENLLDITKRLSQLISKKFNCPSYVNVSGNIDIMESLGYIKTTIDFIDKKFDETEKSNSEK